MTTTTAITHAEGATALTFMRKTLNDFLDTIPNEKMLHQPVKDGNHALWVMGHLATTDSYFRSAFGDPTGLVSESWNDLFGYGSTPTADRAAYPPIEDVRREMDEQRRKLLDWFAAKDRDGLNEPMPDDWKNFAAAIGELPAAMAAHEAMHVGQITMVRKSLGLKPVMTP